MADDDCDDCHEFRSGRGHSKWCDRHRPPSTIDVCTADDLRDVAKQVRDMKESLIFSEARSTDAGMLPPITEQHFLQALAFLDLAERAIKISSFHKMRGE